MTDRSPAELLARMFHENERLARPWSDVPEQDKQLMIATAAAVWEEINRQAYGLLTFSGSSGLTISAMVAEAHSNSVDHGWWDGQRSSAIEGREDRVGPLDQGLVEATIPEKLMLIVTEAAEAMECYREGHLGSRAQAAYAYQDHVRAIWEEATDAQLLGEAPRPAIDPAKLKPEGLPSELADIVIRVADLCGALGINLEEAIRLKMAYNRTRPYRHGNLRA